MFRKKGTVRYCKEIKLLAVQMSLEQDKTHAESVRILWLPRGELVEQWVRLTTKASGIFIIRARFANSLGFFGRCVQTKYPPNCMPGVWRMRLTKNISSCAAMKT